VYISSVVETSMKLVCVEFVNWMKCSLEMLWERDKSTELLYSTNGTRMSMCVCVCIYVYILTFHRRDPDCL
jgi:hypothetical protein